MCWLPDPSSAANNNEYIVVVEAKSGTGDRELTATQTVKVTVSDVDTEAPGVPAVPTVASTTFNSLTIGWEAPDNTGPEITAYDVRHILTSASATDKMDDTKWTEVTAAWTSNNGGNLEYTISSLSSNTSYDVQVRAENDEGTSGWSSYRCRDNGSQCSTRDRIYLTDHCGREQHSSHRHSDSDRCG